MRVEDIKAIARVAALSQMYEGKLVFIKRDDGLYMTRMGGWTDNKRMAAPYDFTKDQVAEQILQIQVEFNKAWTVEVITDDYTKKLMGGDLGAIKQALGQPPVSAKELATRDPDRARAISHAITAPQLALRINDSKNVTAVKDLAEASGMWCEMRDENGFTMSNMPNLSLVDLNTGKQVAYVSYNGRVWPGVQWSADSVPLYDPFAKGGDANA